MPATTERVPPRTQNPRRETATADLEGGGAWLALGSGDDLKGFRHSVSEVSGAWRVWECGPCTDVREDPNGRGSSQERWEVVGLCRSKWQKFDNCEIRTHASFETRILIRWNG
ncbi:hypothetical protein CH63R_06304 [Colletotrichum higginsianum IMI 349063]|uniref:Uncharacterized protein n=1 Tax=Colletotrichum higginsianum (strain IMI 349063) TaxID=759273 RepID=A0A1B7YF47_COLHI|nr:hypothetical protein CH63R_06304 [Colletotrichum higginsianum IMI 349063]OBR10612.1 hypothetical protein CH63R_06304 [Colletotrichum higginsianum IMI 349063]